MSQENPGQGDANHTPPVGDPTAPIAKMVPERDLLTYKTKAEEEIKGLKDQVTELTQAQEQAHNNLIQTQAAKVQLEEQLKEGQATKEQVTQLTTELEANKATVADLNTRLTDQKKEIINKAFGTPMETLNGKTVEQLDMILETFNATGIKKPPPLDLGGGGQGSPVPQTPLEQCSEEIAALRAK